MEEVNHCKYCGCEIPDNLFCCKSCFDDFEELEGIEKIEDDYYDQETEFEDWDD